MRTLRARLSPGTFRCVPLDVRVLSNRALVVPIWLQATSLQSLVQKITSGPQVLRDPILGSLSRATSESYRRRGPTPVLPNSYSHDLRQLCSPLSFVTVRSPDVHASPIL